MPRKIIYIGGAAMLFIIILYVVLYQRFLAAPLPSTESEIFTVPRNASYEDIVNKLFNDGFIAHRGGFRFAMRIRRGEEVAAGGYIISQSMNVWEVSGILLRAPSLRWFVIPEGLRKEEIAEIFNENLSWKEKDIQEFAAAAAEEGAIATEGVYFPDTYLIPVDESGAKTARRMLSRFNEKFASYHEAFTKENIKSDTALKIASIIQREAAGKDDMALISGIIWNRLLRGMKLDIDATVQYARGKTEGGWWAPVRPEDKTIHSPYNTYRENGLPPTPIANPGIAAIEAILYPEDTECIYYLHDTGGIIHCANTYEQHQEHIKKYYGTR